MSYIFSQKVLFKHCDPAGIVFYPRYFEMMNDAIEYFFAEVMGSSFEAMHPDRGIPAIAINIKFISPSRHGDQLSFIVDPIYVGSTSLKFSIQVVCGNEIRIEAQKTVVHVAGLKLKLKPSPWPQEQKALLLKLLKPSAEAPHAMV